MNDAVNISLRFRLMNEPEWRELSLASFEYFDLDTDEIPCLDSCPKFAHACEYLPTDRLVAETELKLSSTVEDQVRIIREWFLNDRRSRLIERCDFIETAPYREVILDCHTGDNKCEILSFVEKTIGLTLLFHVGIELDPYGREHETKFFP